MYIHVSIINIVRALSLSLSSSVSFHLSVNFITREKSRNQEQNFFFSTVLGFVANLFAFLFVADALIFRRCGFLPEP